MEVKTKIKVSINNVWVLKKVQMKMIEIEGRWNAGWV